MLGACVVAVLLFVGTPCPGAGQELPYPVTIVDWDRAALDRQRRAFRSEAEEHEVLFCVESWTKASLVDGIERVVITRVRRERAGHKNYIGDVDGRCVGEDGKALPMFHTHSDGNCQLSPRDLVALVTRAAPFEGVQCGERHFTWAVAWQVLAIATSVERERLERSGGSPP
jgi:hypothetical protein